MLKRMTYDDIANLYDHRVNGRPARTLPMDRVGDWFERQPDCVVDDEGYLCLKTENRLGGVSDLHIGMMESMTPEEAEMLAEKPY